MKNSMALLAMAASFGPATATFNFGSNWQNAGSFTCPGNSNNECKDEYKGGFDWSDLTTGSFSSYNGFNFKGWSCGESAAWGKRTGGSKVIKASCGKESTPSFGCGSNSGVDKFTVSHFDIDVEFDCRLEFHYKMPGGSTCKQSSSCKKGGNKISNSQCGGATDVEIHWPVQDSPKPSCDIQIPSIGFDCGDHTPPKTTSVPVVSKTKTHPGGGHGTTSTAVVPSKSHPGGPESSSVVPSKSHPGGPESSSVVPSKSHPGGPESSSVVPSKSRPGSSVPTKSHPETTPIPSNTGSSVIPSQSSPATTPGGPETTSAPVPSTSEGNSPSSSEESSSSTTEENGPSTTGENSPSTTGNNSPSSPSETQSVPETTITTTYDSTSTIFTTTTKTITSCGPEIPNCPASGTPSTPIIVTETVPVTTTVCPVTETIVPSHTSGNSPVQSSKPPSSGSPSSGSVPSASHTSGNSPAPTGTPDSPLPCPDVVPKCLNSWLHLVEQCSNNLDVACFCPNSDFVEKTFQCIYSYGGSDDIVAEAAAFFQGMCAGYVGENPAIVTGIDTITNILTVTGTPVVSVPYTTIVIETTLTEPCVTGGTTIPGSSTTKTISTEVTIPNISVPSATATATAGPSTTGANSPANPTASTLTTKPPVGTISQVVPTTKPTGVPIAAGNNVKASLGLGLAAMLFAAAM